MCERDEVLSAARARWERERRPHVNTPGRRPQHLPRADDRRSSTRRTCRSSRAASSRPPRRECRRPLPVWVKRGDVHNTQEGDVVFARRRRRAVEAALGRLARARDRARRAPAARGGRPRSSSTASAPAAGPTAGRRGSAGSITRTRQLAGHPLDPRQLARLVRRAAAALGLEVYGGDAIATPAGGLVLLDLNAWPSFALYRDEAAAPRSPPTWRSASREATR